MAEKIASRLESIERQHRRLRILVGLLTAVLVGGGMTAATWHGVMDEQSADRVIRARAVVIEDDNGVVRARLGSDIPDAVSDGDTADRGTQAAGLILYDKTGTERGGYVTFDSNNHVLLTLDAADKGGNYRQTAYFVAEPDGATALRIWGGDDQVDCVRGQTAEPASTRFGTDSSSGRCPSFHGPSGGLSVPTFGSFGARLRATD